MKINFLLSTLTLLLLASCANVAPLTSVAPSAPQVDKNISKDLYQKILPAIYEVVILRPDENNIQYERPLPFDRLSYKIRKDKYASIGTAFAVGDNEFFSAAHVFPLYAKSSIKKYFLRDYKGNVYPVARVLKYSTYRDLITISLESAPAQHPSLSLAKKVEVGDSVLVIGNALGEGISLRTGQVSLFTPEEIENKWQYIRFSAPASPGNSGGPLLNEQGEVLGVVTRKSASENLNYAIPNQELAGLSSSKAEFSIIGQRFLRDHVTVTKNWSFTANLPAEISSLQAAAENNLGNFIEESFRTLYSAKDERFFPANPQFQEYARHQRTAAGIGAVKSPSVGSTWDTLFTKLQTTVIAPDEKIQWSMQNNSYVFHAQKPKSVSLHAFVTDPNLIFEQANKALGIYRNFLGEKFRITSLGEPSEKQWWSDDVGRTWLESVWNLPALGMTVDMHCAPDPEGTTCSLTWLPEGVVAVGTQIAARKQLNQVIFFYHGTVSEWMDFLKEDPKILPDTFRGGHVQLKEGKLNVEFKDKSLVSNQAGLSAQSELSTYTRFTPVTNSTVEIASIYVQPETEHKVFYSLHWSWKPLSQAPKKTLEWWDDMQNKTHKFDGEIHPIKSWNEAYFLARSGQYLGQPSSQYVYCEQSTDENKTSMLENCKNFLNLNQAAQGK